jgi:aspartate/methionine/tyrosine aminotransferase
LGINVDPERELVLTPGTQAGLFTALAATVENGDRVLLADPDYLSSERMLRFLGAVVDHVPLLRTEGGPALDLDYLEESLGRGPSLLLFSNPNNPTGAVYDEASIQRIAEIAIEGDLTVIVDQLYSRLIYDRTLFTNLIAVDGMKERCITLLGPSKTESMSGYRVGVAIAPPTITDSMEDVLSITALRAPAYAQHTLQRWLAEDEDFLSRRIADYQRLRDFTVERLSSVGVLDVYSPQGTAYMFPSVARLGLSDQEVAERLLREARVIVNPGYQFGPRGTGSFRICFAQEEGAWDAALTRMTAIFEILAKSRSTIKEGY